MKAGNDTGGPGIMSHQKMKRKGKADNDTNRWLSFDYVERIPTSGGTIIIQEYYRVEERSYSAF